ncbi:MAG: toxin-antitoxin system YwqK family antitoxin [Planctomycetota bacterium]|jgi:antitoxin component YwqK of YwqJK toxin-antitoxin module
MSRVEKLTTKFNKTKLETAWLILAAALMVFGSPTYAEVETGYYESGQLKGEEKATSKEELEAKARALLKDIREYKEETSHAIMEQKQKESEKDSPPLNKEELDAKLRALGLPGLDESERDSVPLSKEEKEELEAKIEAALKRLPGKKDKASKEELEAKVRALFKRLPEKEESGQLKKEYYGSGALRAEWYVRDGRPEGIYKTYYESGQLHQELNYKNGKPEGIVNEYYESGQLHEEDNYKDGKQEGISKLYSESGQLWWEGNYKNGVMINQKKYGSDGNLESE